MELLRGGLLALLRREDDYRLSCIERTIRLTLVRGANSGKSQAAIEELMSRHGYTNPETERMETGEVRLSYEKEMIDLYFDEDELQFVNFGVFISDIWKYSGRARV
ncbi:hypothetical protein [Hymenobacter radiodurans]|uniref:hypothetical protein n=1 Tax=Hymenobacter radiodurans TaxID=2496028 RepID=UPI001F0D5A8F|nr:hypothetical protein [Hymenobacter radiodurans]